MKPKNSPTASLKLKKFFANEQLFSKTDVLLFISKRIKQNKKLVKKGVGMGVWGYVCYKMNK